MADGSGHDIRIGTLVGAGMKSADYIRQIAAHGFESYSLTFGSTAEGIEWEKLADSVNDALEGTGAVISSIGVYGNLLETEPADLEALKGWEECIDNVGRFNTDIVTGFAGRLRGKPIHESIPRFKEIFEPLAKRAQEKGVRIAFENCDMGGTWQTGDYNIAHNPTAWKMMFDAVPYENLGLQWEPCHQMVSLMDPMAQLKKWAPKMFHIHGKDATIHWDIIREFGIHTTIHEDIAIESGVQLVRPFAAHRTPGFGDSNWTDIISELRLAGFKGSIDIEGWHDPVYRGELEMTGQVHALNYLKRCRGGDYVSNPEV